MSENSPLLPSDTSPTTHLLLPDSLGDDSSVSGYSDTDDAWLRPLDQRTLTKRSKLITLADVMQFGLALFTAGVGIYAAGFDNPPLRKRNLKWFVYVMVTLLSEASAVVLAGCVLGAMALFKGEPGVAYSAVILSMFLEFLLFVGYIGALVTGLIILCQAWPSITGPWYQDTLIIYVLCAVTLTSSYVFSIAPTIIGGCGFAGKLIHKAPLVRFFNADEKAPAAYVRFTPLSVYTSFVSHMQDPATRGRADAGSAASGSRTRGPQNSGSRRTQAGGRARRSQQDSRIELSTAVAGANPSVPEEVLLVADNMVDVAGVVDVADVRALNCRV